MRLRVADVVVVVEDTPILDGVDLHVDRAEVVGLIGPNGSGKSTLLRTVYRHLKPAAGAVHLDGDDVWQLSARRSAQRISVVAQETLTEFDFSAWEVAAMGRTPHKGFLERDDHSDHDIVADALLRVGMAAKAERIYATLSGGEKQLVLLARALAQQGGLLVLDEPTNHLDVHAQLRLLDLVREQQVSTLVAMHDLNLAAAYCDRLYALSGDQVVASGQVDEVLTADLVHELFGVSAHCGVHPHTGRWHLAYPATPARQSVNGNCGEL